MSDTPIAIAGQGGEGRRGAGQRIKSPHAVERSFRQRYSIFALLLLAANLRPAVTSVGPVLENVRLSLGLSGAAAGLLATLPLLIFAAFSAFARVGDMLGIERVLLGSLVLIVAGIVLRSEGSAAALFGGTAIFAVGIGLANVLVPSIIKRDFPRQIETMTTASLMVMALTGATATGIAAPLSVRLAGGWKSSLAVWAVFAVLALLCWLPEVWKADARGATDRTEEALTPVWHSAFAWQIAMFMGLQFLIYYVAIAWIPAFLGDHGVSPADAGWLLTLYQVMSFAAGFVTPALLRLGQDQRPVAVVASLVTALSVLGLMTVPQFAGLWLSVCGVSFGITFILAFALIGLRTRDHRQAASLSMMAQATAYLIAATGPFAFGWLHDFTAGWTIPMASFLAITIVQAAVGFGAGRRGHL
jgi:MFS transporter, CP family, cyanate transporter